ncbi:hypothetical protein BBK82_17840 [Lentzea guizhouensis]|uniref:WXG100 family type VII secretion target n=1 Tax=Lentzea guizhouensis TaxID=1586287 RepID=A0A1B2HIV1_9PSEU|nr:WXG100 family type VII secretion target [Lentzea guizhouensis]ANZ37637.1 hypothetical protein BBK82_17840 [Lentzea guizhouensis]
MADQNEIKKLLDDPNVTPETKKQLVPALAGAGASEEEVERYAKANGVDVPSDPGLGSHILGAALAAPTAGLSTLFVGAKEVNRSQWEKKGGEADKLVSKAKEERELGATQKVLNEQGDVPSSNTLLDAGAPGLRFFEKFIPVYQKAAPACGHQGAAPNLQNDIYRNYDWVRDIEFAKFREDANKFQTVTAKLQEHDNALGSAWNGLGSWEGKAAEAARGYHDKFAGTAKTFIQQTGQAQGAITAGVTNMQKHVKEFAQQIHDQYSEKCGGMTVEEAEQAIRHANGDIFPNDGGILDWLSSVPGPIFGAISGAVFGGGLPGALIGLGWGSWVKNTREGIINDAKEKLKALCQEFDAKKKAFDGYCQAVQTGVQTDYDTMFTALGTAIPENPFGKIGDPPAFTEQGGGRQQVPGTGGGGGGSTGGGGGGSPSGGGGGGGTPEIPKPENPLDKDGDGKPDVPGDTDGDGKPDDLDGDGKPDNQPKPEEELESVTVKAGDNTIKITEPDSNGHVKMTIDTPKGEPKTYDLDFSKNPEAAKALMGQNGAQAVTALANQLTAQGTPTAGGTPAAGGTPTAGGTRPRWRRGARRHGPPGLGVEPDPGRGRCRRQDPHRAGRRELHRRGRPGDRRDQPDRGQRRRHARPGRRGVRRGREPRRCRLRFGRLRFGWRWFGWRRRRDRRGTPRGPAADPGAGLPASGRGRVPDDARAGRVRDGPGAGRVPGHAGSRRRAGVEPARPGERGRALPGRDGPQLRRGQRHHAERRRAQDPARQPADLHHPGLRQHVDLGRLLHRRRIGRQRVRPRRLDPGKRLEHPVRERQRHRLHHQHLRSGPAGLREPPVHAGRRPRPRHRGRRVRRHDGRRDDGRRHGRRRRGRPTGR